MGFGFGRYGFFKAFFKLFNRHPLTIIITQVEGVVKKITRVAKFVYRLWLVNRKNRFRAINYNKRLTIGHSLSYIAHAIS